MQSEYPEGVFSEVEEFSEKEILKRLKEGAEKVHVFKKDSNEHRNAMKRYSDMTPNQKKRYRKILKKRKKL